jgi:tRNA pseudouridine13 synthase
MKLKQQPTDFQVEELTDVRPGSQGSFALYRLEKEGLGTPEALQALCQRWKLDARNVSSGGLKDRHARTTQFVSIWHGPRRGLKQQRLHVHYLGQLAHAFSSDQVTGNRFQIVLRDLSRRRVEIIEAGIAAVRQEGVANYFDDQRFGSVGRNRSFVAVKLIRGDYEGALRLALVEPYEFDATPQRELKQRIETAWGNWSVIQSRLPPGPVQGLVAHLAARPGDFRGAFARLPAHLKSLYLSAYQSHVWNRMLARWLKQLCRPDQLFDVDLRLGDVPMYQGLSKDQLDRIRTQTLPLPSARLHLATDDPLLTLVNRVLEKDHIELRQMKLKHFREPFFAKGDRAVCFIPQELEAEPSSDELNPERQRLNLSFVLPRGCYATMLVKRLMANAQRSPGTAPLLS